MNEKPPVTYESASSMAPMKIADPAQVVREIKVMDGDKAVCLVNLNERSLTVLDSQYHLEWVELSAP